MEPEGESCLEKEAKAEDARLEGRDFWGGKCDYFLSVLGLTIGLGNAWRFPYICYVNGGGAFLVPYLLMLTLVALPTFQLESVAGQFTSCSGIGIYSVCPAFKGLGISALLILIFVDMYFVPLVAYSLLYLYHSLGQHLPWASCGNPWNTPACARFLEFNESQASTAVSGNVTSQVLSAEEFFHNKVLELSGGAGEVEGLVWPVVAAVAVTWVVIFLSVFKGVRVLGKVVWFTATFPYLILTILLIRGLTLPGAWDGIYFYIYPEFDKLMQPKVWAAAASQIFFSMTLGCGVITTAASHSTFRSGNLRWATLAPVVSAITSIYIGFVVFSVLGYMAHTLGTTVDKVTAAGSALAFIIYPEAVALMPLAPLWSALFFLALFLLSVDSAFANIEALQTMFLDGFPALRRWRGWVSFGLCCLMFLGSSIIYTRAGMYWITILDWYSTAFAASANGVCQLAVFSFIYGVGRTLRDVEVMTQKPASAFWYVTWLVVTPILAMAIFFNLVLNYGPANYNGEVLPAWAQGVGWCTALSAILAIPSYFIYYLTFRTKGTLLQRLQQGLSPSAEWGPAAVRHRKLWERYYEHHPLRHRLLRPQPYTSCECLYDIEMK